MTSRPIHLPALLGAVLLVLAACGGGGTTTAPTLPTVEAGGSSEASTTTTTAAVDPEDAFQDYSECMREHGVEMPDPGSAGGEGGVIVMGGEDMDFAAFEEASAACDSILEGAFGEFEMTPEQQAEIRDQELAFAKCMRDNGVEDWPDPTGDLSGGMSIELPDELDPDDLNAAMEVCSTEVFGGSGAMMFGGPTP